MPSKSINNTILKKVSMKHNRAVVSYYQPKQKHMLINKKSIKGKRHGIEIGKMNQFKEEVASPVINKDTQIVNKKTNDPNTKMKKVGSKGKSAVAKPLKAGAKSKRNIEKVGKKLHTKK